MRPYVHFFIACTINSFIYSSEFVYRSFKKRPLCLSYVRFGFYSLSLTAFHSQQLFVRVNITSFQLITSNKMWMEKSPFVFQSSLSVDIRFVWMILLLLLTPQHGDFCYRSHCVRLWSAIQNALNKRHKKELDRYCLWKWRKQLNFFLHSLIHLFRPLKQMTIVKKGGRFCCWKSTDTINSSHVNLFVYFFFFVQTHVFRSAIHWNRVMCVHSFTLNGTKFTTHHFDMVWKFLSNKLEKKVMPK